MPHAFATVKVQVQCNSNWSPETTCAQVTRQAIEDAKGQLRSAFKGRHDMKVIGEPEITMVHTGLTESTQETNQ
jgi:hypothetical protein